MSILVEHKIHDCGSGIYGACNRQGKCEDDCPRCAQDKIVALIKQYHKKAQELHTATGEGLFAGLLKELEA